METANNGNGCYRSASLRCAQQGRNIRSANNAEAIRKRYRVHGLWDPMVIVSKETPMNQSSSAETAAACLAAAARGVAWLLDQQTAAGSWRQLEAEVFDAYYKGGWALAVSGQPAAAHRLLTHVQRAFFTAEGDFEPRGAPAHRHRPPLRQLLRDPGRPEAGPL